jgi:uncharacterized membrane-anchored protein
MTTGQARWDGPRGPAGYAASKVPLITVYFWIIKLLSTAMGEATSDYLVRAINPVIAVLFGAFAWAIAMVLQFRAKAYNAWIYWLAVVMVAVFGTMCADVLHIKFHVPYAASTTFYAIVLAVIFVLWYRSEGTLSIHSIRTPRREAFYWATVLATFALGTATGDLTARTLNLGYLASGIWFLLAFAAVAIAHWKFGLNSILAFWIAYVLTRPVGASFADYVAFPHAVGGLGVGHAQVALVLTFFIVCLVGYLAVTRKDVEEVPGGPLAQGPARRGRAAGSGGGYRPAPRQVDPYAREQMDPYARDPRPPQAPYRGPGYYSDPPSRDPRSVDPRPRDPRPQAPQPMDPGPRGPYPRPRAPWPPEPSGPMEPPGQPGPQRRDPWPPERPESRAPRRGDTRPVEPGSREPRRTAPWPRQDRRDPDEDAAARPREGFFAWDDE